MAPLTLLPSADFPSAYDVVDASGKVVAVVYDWDVAKRMVHLFNGGAVCPFCVGGFGAGD